MLECRKPSIIKMADLQIPVVVKTQKILDNVENAKI